MSRVRSIIATAAAVTLTTAQLLCLCGPVGATQLSHSVDQSVAQVNAAAHESHGMAGHHGGSGDSSAAPNGHSHGNTDCFHCDDTASVAGSHVEVAATDGTGFQYPELVLVRSSAPRQIPTPVVTEHRWRPPDLVQRAPETLVSLKTLLLI